MGITLPAGWEIIYNKTLRMYDISIVCNVGKNPIWFPRKRFLNLKEITYLYNIAYIWGNFEQSVKDEWKAAADIIGQHNYNLFVQDKSYRIKNGIGSNAIPSVHHQYFVGHLKINSPSNSAKITQYNFTKILFPATLKISAKTNLTADGANPSAIFRIIYNIYKTGQTIEQVETINIPLINAWESFSQIITEVSGRKGRWRCELVLTDVVGDIWFDNLIVEYSAQIRLNDPYCLDVVKWWQREIIDENVNFETIYPVGGAL